MITMSTIWFRRFFWRSGGRRSTIARKRGRLWDGWSRWPAAAPLTGCGKKQAYYRAQERYREEINHHPEPCVEHGADCEAACSETGEIFQKVMANLPVAQREALQLAFYRGLSQREIAAKTGIPLGTIKTRLELALRKVRSAILALGGEREWMPALAHS
jgi:RNA polymerase sigma-70 factor (ECF subfamily)